jgi:ADP-ribose pyrophosphatase
VEQPREAVGAQALLELPAGKLDEEAESPLEAAKRELAEEIGKGARNWEHLATFWMSPGFTNEEMHVFLATDLYDEHAEADETERIQVRRVPLSDLDETIAGCRDAKSLVGLLWLKAYKA